MTMQFRKQIQNQSQTGYMQSNEPKTIRWEAERKKIQIRQDRIIENQSQNEEMMIKNTQNKKENSKNKSMLSEHYIHKKNRIKTHSQSGRSMVEMLGVLAIIAILSIGGIVGYKLAMNYYQADQIANEINLMRNDLKVKYAFGNEELLLGDPYDDTPADENYSGHLSTQYDRYPIDYDCIRKDKAEFYNCRETDAYYIKVGNVSKGVCKPLTTLLNGMDGLMYIEINKQPYEDDLCSSDEANEIYIEFDAEEVNGNYDSNRPEGWCAKDEDCEGLSTPVCDKDNNECVECTENADCDSNICRKDHTCGECTSDSDCANPRPICDEETATCVGCAVDDECPDTNKPNCDTESGACCDDPLMTWNGSECVCPEDYAKSETSSGKAVCLPYCEQEVGVVLLIDHSGLADMINDSGLNHAQKYYKAFEQMETALEQLNIPQEVYSAVYLSGYWYNKNRQGCDKVCNGWSSGSDEGYKINEHLEYGLHTPAQIAAAIKIDKVKDDILNGGCCTTVGYAIRDKVRPLCKTGERKLIIIIYWDVYDDITDPQLQALLQECPQTKIYNVALNGKPYAGAAGNFNLNNINDLNNDINNALNEAIQQEACVQKNK